MYYLHSNNTSLPRLSLPLFKTSMKRQLFKLINIVLLRTLKSANANQFLYVLLHKAHISGSRNVKDSYLRNIIALNVTLKIKYTNRVIERPKADSDLSLIKAFLSIARLCLPASVKLQLLDK